MGIGYLKLFKMHRYYLTSLLLTISLGLAFGQPTNSYKNDFSHGKELYSMGRYELAMEVLKPLTLPTNKSIYSPYAGYYYGLSAYKKGYSFLSEEMLKSILNIYPDWEKIDLVRLWLSKIYFEEKDYLQALAVIDKVKSSEINAKCEDLTRYEVSQIDDFEIVYELYQLYPENKALGEILADKIVNQPLLDQDRDLLRNLVSIFDLDKVKYKVIHELVSEKKETYNIAVLFPFMLEELNPTSLKMNNQFVLDIFEGIKVATRDLNTKGIRINVFAYDTERSAIKTQKIILSGELDGMDLLIGPLYPETVGIVSEYSHDRAINMFNPLSTNKELIENNPYSFLMKPTTEHLALAASDYVIGNLKNKNAIIFYEDTPKDSIAAFTYKVSIERDSFNVIFTQKLTGLDTVSVYNSLTQKVRFDDLNLSSEDSLRIIERHDLYDYFKRLGRVRTIEERRKIRPLEIFRIAPDSIGHIFVASNRELIGASTISGIETRGDSIVIIGNESWLTFKSVSLNQLERLSVLLLAPSYISHKNAALQDVNQKLLYTLNQPPTKYHYLGYETINFVGEMLNLYGVYFQVGLRTQGIYPGVLYQGYNYMESNDNIHIPIIEFKNSEFWIVN